LAVSPEPELRSRETPRKGSLESRSARVKRELLAETNGPYTTSELSYFLDRLLVVGPYEEIFCAVVSAHLFYWLLTYYPFHRGILGDRARLALASARLAEADARRVPLHYRPTPGG